MIIKNNFNNKSIDPLNDYKGVRKSRNDDIENDEFINRYKNPYSKVIDDIKYQDKQFDNNDKKESNWNFFK